MSPLPEQMVDRWQGRPMLPPGRGRLYWHVLLGDHPQVRALAADAYGRLAGGAGLHWVPHRWLHLTTLIAGLADDIPAGQIDAMVTEARGLLADIRPVTVRLARVLYHPEAIAVHARPADALTPVLHAVQAATRAATGRDGQLGHQPWTPHVTLAYSTTRQPAAPLIAALGRELPAREVTIRDISLVVQDGPEYMWNWHPIAEVPLGTAAAADAAGT